MSRDLLGQLVRPAIRDHSDLARFTCGVTALALAGGVGADIANQLVFFIDWQTSLRSWLITATICVVVAAPIAFAFGKSHLELYQAKLAADVLSRTDSLTDLPNRRALIETTEASLPNVLALAIFDIDRFKTVNDTYGHLAGDAAIRAVARMMAADLGNLGCVARVGGEEFAVLASGVAIDELARRLIAFRDRLRATPIVVGELTIRLTVSAGVALRDDDQSFDLLYSDADRALYQAKSGGRNRIQFACAPEAPRPAAARREPSKREAAARRA
jgi:diguanylate cyclase (GGDEF)-like protein